MGRIVDESMVTLLLLLLLLLPLCGCVRVMYSTALGPKNGSSMGETVKLFLKRLGFVETSDRSLRRSHCLFHLKPASCLNPPECTTGAIMMPRRDAPGRGCSRSSIARNLVTCILALDRLVNGTVGAETSPASSRTPRQDAPFVASAADQIETLFDDLPEGFHDDIDSITLAVGGHHTCALEYRPGVDFGGPVRCWGRDDWGQSTPSDEIFVQVWLLVSSYNT